MTLYNTEENYGSLMKAFHWVAGTLFLTQLLIGMIMSLMPTTPFKFQIYTVHKSIGIILVFVSTAFIAWRFQNPKPRWPAGIPAWEKLAAILTQRTLYGLFLVMSLSGWIMSTASGHIPLFLGLFPAPLPGIPTSKLLASIASNIHYYAAWLSALLAGLHIAAAIKHHCVDRDDILKRML